jgi:hypothetical protein
VTDRTPGAGDPVEPDTRFGPETPGPEATPEQEAHVAALLGSLRADDPEIPEHVAARIDGVLAELRRTEPVPLAGLAGAVPLADSEDSDRAATGAGADATVLPMPRRESSTSRTFRWVAGAAAAVVVLGGGAAVLSGALGGGATSGSSVTAADSASGGGPVPLRSTGTDYSSDALAAQAQSLVAEAAKGGTTTPEIAPEATPDTAATDASGSPDARTLLTSASVAACLEQLTGAPGATPVAIDQGTYEGKPADVVVLPSPDDPQRLEVWVIGPGCTRESVQLYEFRTIPSAGGATQPEAPQSDAPAPASPAEAPAAP